MSAGAAIDRTIEAAAEQLQALQSRLGPLYWSDPEAEELRTNLRQLIGSYGAWAEDRLPRHQRLRQAAAYEQRFAPLLWPDASGNAG